MVMLEHSDHPPDAPDDGVGIDTLLSYADHAKRMQSIADGIGSLDQDPGLDQTALNKPTAFLNHITLMKEGIQAMDKYYSEM